MNRRRPLLAVVWWCVLLWLYVPLLAVAVMSFNASRFGVQWSGFSLTWYAALLSDREVAAALVNSLIVSGTATLLSTLLGTLLAVGLSKHHFRGKRLVEASASLPMLTPDIILGVSMVVYFTMLGISLGYGTIIASHIAYQIPFVAFIVRAGLQSLDPALEDAARDLGAGEWQVLTRVTLPSARWSIAAAAVTAFALSFDDFVITFFTAGSGTGTLPLQIYSMLKRGVSPKVNALFTILMVAGVLLAGAASLLAGRRSADSADFADQ